MQSLMRVGQRAESEASDWIKTGVLEIRENYVCIGNEKRKVNQY